MAAPTWVAAGTKADKPGTSGTTLNVSPPAGHAANDLLVIAVHLFGGGNTLSTPAGWTLLGDSGQWATSHRTYLFRKLAASGSEPAVTLTMSSANFCDAQMYAFRGVNTSTPIDAATVFGAAGATANVPVPALTTTTADALMVFLGDGATSTSWTTPPAGATERIETGFWIGMFVLATEVKTSPGTEAAATYNRGASGQAICAAFAIRPVSAAPPVAAFSGTPLSGAAPLNVTFTDASTNTPASWAWDFGDGGNSSSQNPSHNYTVPGTYTVTLTATNAGGSDAEVKTGYVVVSETIVYAEGGGITIA